MLNSKLGPALVLSHLVLMLLPAHASQDYLRASSLQSALLVPCRQETEAAKTQGCQSGSLDRLASKIDQRLQTVLAKADATTQPLIKRDQVWFNEMVGEFAHESWTGDPADGADRLGPILKARIATLEAMSPGLMQSSLGVAGRWENAFGHVMVTPKDHGAFHVLIETRAPYGPYQDHRFSCRVESLVHPAPGEWIEGRAFPSPQNRKQVKTTTDPSIRIRRQGATMRIIAGDESKKQQSGPLDCNNANQITGTYFPVGKPAPPTRARPKQGTPLSTSIVSPSFDCAHPSTVADEEVCADPELAANDVRMSQAWTRLLPRLDGATLAHFKQDQLDYVRSQARQYVHFLHPAWDKQYSYVHQTGFGRDKLAQLQRERIALLEGFDETRVGLEGLWLAHNAILRVTTADGKLKADGWKWEQGDWKAGCDFAMEGVVEGAAFVSGVKQPNSDTLEREGASLVVNRKDDAFASQRGAASGSNQAEAGEPKCKRNSAISSTVRLFPARPSPDIDSTPGEIR